jgi:hypothetical protein
MSLQSILSVCFVQVFLAALIIAVLGFLFMHWLTFTTHGNEITVPNLEQITEERELDLIMYC